MKIVAAGLLLGSIAFAQRIEGNVRGITGEPIPRATVSLVDAAAPAFITTLGWPATVADDAGKFVFDNVEPGRANRVVAERPGYLRAAYGARSPAAPGIPVTVEAGSTLTGIEITMTPQGVISGRVTDPRGDAVEGVLVIPLRRDYRNGVRQLIPWTLVAVATNDQGAFRLAEIPPGRYYVLAFERPGQVRAGSMATYYPSARNPEAAAPLDVTPGAELRGIDIRFLTAKTYAIRGRVDVSAAAGERVSVMAMPKGLTFGDTSASVRADNSFEILNLAPGTYVIQTLARAIRNGEPGTRQGGDTEVTITNADLNGLVIPVTTNLSITGTITVEGEDVRARRGAHPILRGRPGTTTPVVSVSPQVEANGTFRMSGLAPGNYQLHMAELPASFYVKSARFGDQDALHGNINVTRSGGELVIVLSTKAAEVKGTLRSDHETAASLTGFLVTLWPMDPEPASATDGVRTAYTDRNGAFQFRGLPPGEYFVTAWEDADPELVQSRDFLGAFASEAAKVTLAEGSTGTVEAKLVPLEKIKAAEAKLP